MFLPS